MKFELTTLYVTNMEKSLHFYNEILEMPIVKRQPIGNGKELVFLGVEGEPNLELIPVEEAPDYSGFSIGFSVDSMAFIKERLRQNNFDVEPDEEPGEGPQICFFDGPNGEKIELIEW